jgi:PIN domain nuclease of toxin-antitoxin system
LLDTQIFLWFLDQPRRIPAAARDVVEAVDNAVFVSAAAIWEIAIKASIGRLKISSADLRRLPRLIGAAGFDEFACPGATRLRSPLASLASPGSVRSAADLSGQG